MMNGLMRPLTWLLVLLALIGPATPLSAESVRMATDCGGCCCKPEREPAPRLDAQCCWKVPARAPSRHPVPTTPPALGVGFDLHAVTQMLPGLLTLPRFVDHHVRWHDGALRVPERPVWQRLGVQLI